MKAVVDGLAPAANAENVVARDLPAGTDPTYVLAHASSPITSNNRTTTQRHAAAATFICPSTNERMNALSALLAAEIFVCVKLSWYKKFKHGEIEHD